MVELLACEYFALIFIFLVYFKVKQEKPDWVSMTNGNETDGNSRHLNISRPDFLLDSNWFGLSADYGKDYFILRDAIGALLAEDVA